VSVDTRNTYYGLYALDTLDLAQGLAATAGARLNLASIAVRDRLGTSPDLNGNHSYTRLNPVAGLTYKFAPAFGREQTRRSVPFTVFASIASSRVRIVPPVLVVSEDRRAKHRNCEGPVQSLAYLCQGAAYKCTRGAAPPYAHGSSRNRQQRAVGSCVLPYSSYLTL
jgi:hypothetical protein